MSYVCSCCGETHEGLPDIAFDQPTYAREVPDSERATRVKLGTDLCVVDDEHYFVRGVIAIPIRDHPETLGIGAWVSQKMENFRKYEDHDDSADIGPFFGWLSNDVPFAGTSALHLKTMVHFQGGDLRPLIRLEPTDHPLAAAQRDGISLEEAWEFVHQFWDREAE